MNIFMKRILFLAMTVATMALVACTSNSKPAPQKPVVAEPVHEATIEEYEAVEKTMEKASQVLQDGMMPGAATE